MTVNDNGVVEDYSEEVMESHNKELAGLREYANEYAKLFNKTKERNVVFDKFLQSEVCL